MNLKTGGIVIFILILACIFCIVALCAVAVSDIAIVERILVTTIFSFLIVVGGGVLGFTLTIDFVESSLITEHKIKYVVNDQTGETSVQFIDTTFKFLEPYVK
jgi:hypothetical protein